MFHSVIAFEGPSRMLTRKQHELLIFIAEAKLIASDKNVTAIEVRGNKLMLTRGNDYLTIGGKFPRLSKKQPQAKLKEILRFLKSL